MENNKNNEIDLMEIVHLLWMYKKIVILIILSFVLGATLISFMVTSMYESKVLLAPISTELPNKNTLSGSLGGLASVVGLGGSGGRVSEIDINRSIFVSGKFTSEFIIENNLLQIIYEDQWDKNNKKWRDEPPFLMKAVKYFDKKIRGTSVNKETGLLTLSIKWSDPEIAAKWAKTLVIRINKILRDHYLDDSRKNLNFLESQVVKTQNSEIKSLLYSLIKKEIKKNMLVNSRTEFAYKTIDPAFVAEERISPNRILYVLMGGIFGGIVSVIVVWRLGRTRKHNII